MIRIGDCRDILPTIPDGIAHTCITSPPYWGLRDYGGEKKQIGSEPTLPEYIETLVKVFREVRRILRKDGTLWLNIGDCYTGARGGAQGKNSAFMSRAAALKQVRFRPQDRHVEGLPKKSLILLPARVAMALQLDGWILRSDVIWNKPNATPESVKDRPAKCHEHLYLFSKSQRYYYDMDVTRTPQKTRGERHEGKSGYRDGHPSKGGIRARDLHPLGGNMRDVWTVPTQPYRGAHFAVFPPKLIEPCILAGAPPGGVVFDPFMGSGTTALVAQRLGRQPLGVELNSVYADQIYRRMFNG